MIANEDKITAGGAILARLKAVASTTIFRQFRPDFRRSSKGWRGCGAANSAAASDHHPAESAAMAMAHGYYLATGRAQA